jgi:hypothetical protein
MELVCYKTFSLDDTKVKDNTVWCKIKFAGLELDLNSRRIVFVFEKSFFTDNGVLDFGQFITTKIFHTVDDEDFDSTVEMLFIQSVPAKDSIMQIITKIYEN